MLDQGQEQMLYRDIIVSQRLGFLFRAQQDLIQGVADIDLGVGTLYLGQAVDLMLGVFCKAGRIDSHLFDQSADQGILQCQQRVQQVLLLDLLIAVFIGQLLTVVDGLYGLLCKFLNVHLCTSFGQYSKAMLSLFYNYYNTYMFLVNTFFFYFYDTLLKRTVSVVLHCITVASLPAKPPRT